MLQLSQTKLHFRTGYLAGRAVRWRRWFADNHLDVSLKDGGSQIRLLVNGADFTVDGSSCGQSQQQLVGRQFDRDRRHALFVASIQGVGETKQRGEVLNHPTIKWRQLAEFVV